MNFKDALEVVLKYVHGRKLRTWLTVLGIVMGIAAIVALVATSRSLEASIEQQFEDFGADKINIFAASTSAGSLGFGASLNTKDIEAVERVSDYGLVAGLLSKSAKVAYRDDAANLFIYGVEADMAGQGFG